MLTLSKLVPYSQQCTRWTALPKARTQSVRALPCKDSSFDHHGLADLTFMLFDAHLQPGYASVDVQSVPKPGQEP